MKRFLFWSLKQQLFLIIVITLGPSLLLYAWFAESHFLVALDQQFNDRLALFGQLVRTTMPINRYTTYGASDIQTTVYQSDLQRIREMTKEHELDRLTVTDPNGRICIDSAGLLPGSLFALVTKPSKQAQGSILFQTKTGQWLKPYLVPLSQDYHLHLSAGNQMLTVVRATRLRRNLTLFFGGLMAMLASWLFIAMLSKRLSKLTQGFNLLKLGHPNPQIKLSGQDEIAYLVQSFNDTATKLEEREKIVALEHESRLSDMKILAAGVAHEIRNPLAAISGMIDLVDRSITSNTLDRAHDLIDRSRQEIARMDIIIKDMMGYAKQPNINLVPTPIPSLLEEMAQIDHHCTLRMTKPLPQLPLDAIAIKTVLRNLLINAREATGPDGELVMGTRLYKKRLLIYVQDNGPGIPKTERSNIFTPFYSSKARGSGLGLAIAKNIINAHHGQLKYRTGSSGSLFVIGFNLPKE